MNNKYDANNEYKLILEISDKEQRWQPSKYEYKTRHSYKSGFGYLITKKTRRGLLMSEDQVFTEPLTQLKADWSTPVHHH